MTEQTITFKTSASKARLKANTLWVTYAMAKKLNGIQEESQLKDVVQVMVASGNDAEPIMLMTKETATKLYEDLGMVLNDKKDNKKAGTVKATDS